MSSGLMSAIRFWSTSWSSDGFDPPDAFVISFWFDGIAMFDTMTPSIT